MKKIGILLAMLLVAGVCAMADEAVIVQDNLLFTDIDAVALSQTEMEAVDGSAHIIDKPGDVAPGKTTPKQQPSPKVEVEQDVVLKIRIPPYCKYPLIEFEIRRKTKK